MFPDKSMSNLPTYAVTNNHIRHMCMFLNYSFLLVYEILTKVNIHDVPSNILNTHAIMIDKSICYVLAILNIFLTSLIQMMLTN